MDFFSELKVRTDEIRHQVASAGATLVPGQGLEQALIKAEAIASAGAFPSGDTLAVLMDKKRAVCAIWNLAETLRPCVSRNLPIDTQLRNITSGSIDYGVADHGRHYFKDFELELYTAAECINKGLPNVSMNPSPSDPDGDLFLETLRCEVKHPNSFKQISDNLGDFNTEITARGMFGVMVMGVEDMFGVSPPMFASDSEFEAWMAAQRAEVEFFARRYYQMVDCRDRILVAVQIWTVWRPVNGTLSLFREGNAILFDNRSGVPAQQYADAERIASVFNPSFHKWNAIKGEVNKLYSESDKAKTRRALQKTAYEIWQREGEPVGRALNNWLQAKADFNLPHDLDI